MHKNYANFFLIILKKRLDKLQQIADTSYVVMMIENERRPQMTGTELKETFGEVVSSYSRAQAIEDGFLLDFSKEAKEAGIVYPVAVTNALFEKHVNTEGTKRSGDTAGRMWDLVWMLRCAIKSGRNSRSEGNETVVDFCARFGRSNVWMTSRCHAGDNFEPVITVDFYGEPNR